MADHRKHRASVIKGILGRDAVPSSVIARSMADLEKVLDRRFGEIHRRRMELARAHGPLREKLIGKLRKDPAWVASIWQTPRYAQVPEIKARAGSKGFRKEGARIPRIDWRDACCAV